MSGEHLSNDHETSRNPGKVRKLKAAFLATTLLSMLPSQTTHEHDTNPVRPDPETSTTYRPPVEASHPTESIPTEIGEASRASQDMADNNYQQEFMVDHNDQEATQSQVNEFISNNEEIFSHPEAISKIMIIGMSSAEDNGAEKGLDQPSTANLMLARQRADLARQSLIQTVLERSGVNITDKIVMSEIEDSLSAEEIAHVDQLVAQYGYSSSGRMIDQYNRQRSTSPPEVISYLDQILAARRGAHITVEAIFEAPAPASTTGSSAGSHQPSPSHAQEARPAAPAHRSETVFINPPHDDAVIPETPTLVSEIEETSTSSVSSPVSDPIEFRRPPHTPGSGPKVEVPGPPDPRVWDPPPPPPPPPRFDHKIERGSWHDQPGYGHAAHHHKQPLPGNYTPRSGIPDGRAGHKGQHQDRKGR